MGNVVCETGRLRLRHITLADASFLVRQLNEPSWIRFIGDRGVHDEAGAHAYIEERFFAPLRTLGYGMYVIELKSSGEPVGLCGLVKRPYLDHPDLGFALLESQWGQGYAREAAQAVVEQARSAMGVARLYAITATANERSGSLLRKLGFRLENEAFPAPDGQSLKLYAVATPAARAQGAGA
jgi:RimJ/RimL family protein N-acetyltransferase